jgi:hypothetical protein
MGYDLHIEREYVFEPITREQCVEYVRSDPDMETVPPGRLETTCPDGSVLGYDHGGFWVWTRHPRHDPDGYQCTFWYRDGQLIVSDPDDETVEKMRDIAERIGAHVRGDDGESY